MTLDLSIPRQVGMTSPEMGSIIIEGLERMIAQQSQVLLKMEADEEFVAYVQLLQLLRSDPNAATLIQEPNVLYDKVFYMADTVSYDSDGALVLHVPSGTFVRLNDKVPVNGLSTVNEIRKSEKNGVLFSGVAAIGIDTKEGKRIPLLRRRDNGAPTDAGKYTLPAGRADKVPGLTAYEELIEELVIFGRKDNKIVQVVPYLENGGISEEKARQLASMARGRYINALIKVGGGNILLQDINDLITAEIVLEPLTVNTGGIDVKTIFSDKPDNIIIESGFFPLHDTAVNTYELVRGFCLDLRSYDSIHTGDGDGFGRETKLFSEVDFENIGSENMVASLRGAIEQGAFKSR